jgi:hypothetical protein
LSATSLTIVNGTTAQFSVATITIGTFTVGISGTGIADLAGNTGLTGALSNTLSTKYGDVNGSGSVTNADLNAIRNSYLNGLPYNPFLDLNQLPAAGAIPRRFFCWESLEAADSLLILVPSGLGACSRPAPRLHCSPPTRWFPLAPIPEALP